MTRHERRLRRLLRRFGRGRFEELPLAFWELQELVREGLVRGSAPEDRANFPDCTHVFTDEGLALALR